jgi:c-di-GMP-binding flagellar brake protein YcgR
MLRYTPLDLATLQAPEERRQWPRVHLECPVAVDLPSRGNRLKARLMDLSGGGLQVRCSRAQVLELVPAHGDDGQSANCVWAHWLVDLEEGPLLLEANCRRCYAVKTGEDEIALGFEFIELSEASRARLNAWLMRQLEPAELPVPAAPAQQPPSANLSRTQPRR